MSSQENSPSSAPTQPTANQVSSRLPWPQTTSYSWEKCTIQVTSGLKPVSRSLVDKEDCITNHFLILQCLTGSLPAGFQRKLQAIISLWDSPDNPFRPLKTVIFPAGIIWRSAPGATPSAACRTGACCVPHGKPHTRRTACGVYTLYWGRGSLRVWSGTWVLYLLPVLV